MISIQKLCQFLCRFLQICDSRQIYHTKMIRFIPVESATMYNQDSLLSQQIQCKFFVVVDVEFLHIQFRENVECGFRFLRRYSRNIIQQFIDHFSLFIDSSARLQILFYALISAKRRLNNRLCRYIRTKTHIGKHLDSLDITCCCFFISSSS